MTAGSTGWPFVEVTVDGEDADAIGSVLIDAGSTGVEHRSGHDGSVVLVAWFRSEPDEVAIRAAIATGTDGDAAAAAAGSMRFGATPDDDWLRVWKRGFEPTPVGTRLLVYPSWRREASEAIPDRIRIEVDPGMAFGTGTHETTRLCLEWLDEFWGGGSLLDVGCGTGILAIAAARLEAGGRIVAVDVDPVAVEVALENADRNSVSDMIVFDTNGPEGVPGCFDVVLANLTADVILGVREALVARLAADGRLVVSGVLDVQADEVSAELVAAGLESWWRRDAGEWVAMAFRRP